MTYSEMMTEIEAKHKTSNNDDKDNLLAWAQSEFGAWKRMCVGQESRVESCGRTLQIVLEAM